MIKSFQHLHTQLHLPLLNSSLTKATMHLVDRKDQNPIVVLEQSAKRKRRYRVRFEEDDRGDSYSNCILPEIAHDQVEDTWYTNGDFARLKETAKLICKESQSSSFVALLRESYGTSQRSLDLWAIHGRSLRGLEHAVARKHGYQRKRCRNIMYQAVLEGQRHMKVSGVDHHDASHCLAKIASTCSKPARDFATRMGLADQRALVDVQNPVEFNRRKSSYIPRVRAAGMKDWERRPSQLIPASTGTDEDELS